MSCFALIVLTLSIVVRGQSVPIVVDAYLPDAKPNAPVTFGVPFARGVLAVADATDVRIIDDTGAVVPHQQSVTATWDPSGATGVRWLLIDMLVNADRKYTLQRGGGEAVTVKPVATLKGDAIEINNGRYSGTISTKGFDLFRGLKFRGESITHSGVDTFSGFYIEHEKKGLFRSDLDPEATVVLEETGPVRATLKADGWYTNASGEKFCRYSIRAHFFRDHNEIKIEHTFIFTGLSAEDRIAALGMRVQRHDPASKTWSRTYVGDDDLLAGHATSTTPQVTQMASERGRLDFYAPHPNGLMKLADRGGGWMYGEGAASFTVAIRDAWQQYPWGLKFDAGAIDVALWPREAGLLDLSWDGYWSDLTDRQKHFMADHMARRTDVTVDHWMDMLRQASNATGAAKTHEIWFSPFPDRNLPREVAYPTVAHADPAWMCATEALALVPQVSADAGLFEDEEIVLRQMLTMMQDAIAANHWYGWWNWGGYHQHLDPAGPIMPRFGLWADDAGMGTWHRARPKSHYQWGRFPWLQYMRSGDRDWLRYAQTYTLYSADRAHSHHRGHGREDGSEFHYDNSVVPWLGGYRKYPGGDMLWSPLQSKEDYVYAYWLTGSRRAWDVLQANGRLLLAAEDPVRFKVGFERGNDIRNAGMMLERVMLLYQATWDARYRALADRIAGLFLTLDTAEKVRQAEYDSDNRSYFHQASTWAYQGMWFYDRVAQDPAFRKVLQLFIDRCRDVDAGFTNSQAGQNGSPRALTYGYLLTGDTTYLELARPVWDELVGEGITRLQFNPGGKQELSGLPALLGAMASAPQAWRDANVPTRQRGSVLTWRCFTRNNDPYQPGTRAFIREERDGAWTFVLASNAGGTFALIKPDGEVAQTVTFDPAIRNWARIDVPTDGQQGDYALVCTAIDAKLLPQRARFARIVGCPLPVTIEIGLPGRDLGVSGRAYSFMPDPAAPQANVSVIPLDPQRHLTLRDASGATVATTVGDVPFLGRRVTIDVPPAHRAGVLTMTLSLDPHACYQSHEGTRLWGFHGTFPLLAATPDDYFIPVIPGSLSPLRPAQ